MSGWKQNTKHRHAGSLPGGGTALPYFHPKATQPPHTSDTELSLHLESSPCSYFRAVGIDGYMLHTSTLTDESLIPMYMQNDNPLLQVLTLFRTFKLERILMNPSIVSLYVTCTAPVNATVLLLSDAITAHLWFPKPGKTGRSAENRERKLQKNKVRPSPQPGNRDSTVVKVLRYKSEGRWFDSRWCHWNFSFT